jgi:hypothetical protein
MILIEHDDFPSGFMGESQWFTIERALELFAPDDGRGRGYECGFAKSSLHWTGMTGKLDDGLSDTQRHYAKRKTDKAWMDARNARRRQLYAARPK